MENRIALVCFVFLLLFVKVKFLAFAFPLVNFPLTPDPLPSFLLGGSSCPLLRRVSFANIFCPVFTLFFDFIMYVPIKLLKFYIAVLFVSS